jgi:hypothetical protein
MGVESNAALTKDYVNIRGREIQQNLHTLLSTLSYVTGVRETTKDDPEDKRQIDLVVGLDQSKAGVNFPEVFVQAKASTTGVFTFYRHISLALRKQGLEDNINRENWLLANRIIVLVGDLHISRSRKSRQPVTNEQIITSFEAQLKKINDYKRSKTPAQPF